MKTLFTLLCIFVYQITNAQLKCGTLPMTSQQNNALQNFSISIPNNGITINGIKYLPIKAHIVRKTDGTGGLSLGDLNLGLSRLNRDFYPKNIQFYFCGTQPNYINNTTYYDLDGNTEESGLITGNQVDDAINVYFLNLITINRPLQGYARYPGAKPTNNLFIINSSIVNGTWQHELGHYFGLLHTLEAITGQLTDELVTRTGTNANCTTKGDFICDTPADPYEFIAGKANSMYTDGGCTYVGTINGISVRDINGDVYTPQLNNLMSYSFEIPSCQTPTFTNGQFSRVEQGLNLRLSYANQSGGYNIEGCSGTLLNAPSNLSGTNAILNWTDNSTTETGFIIERSTSSSSGFIAIGGVPPNIITYTDNDNIFVSGTTYYYRVKASNTTTNYSNIASVVSNGGLCVSNRSLFVPVISGTQTFRSSDFITSNSQISGNGTSVVYRAGNKITLTQGFKVMGGAVFTGFLQVCTNGTRQSSELFVNEEIEGIELSAYPNPTSSGEVIIQYTIPEDGNASINLANIVGVSLRHIVEDKFHEKGTYKVKASLSDLKTGVYLYILQGDKVRLAKKLVVE